MGELVDALEARLRAVATPERAEQERRYLKSDLEFIGATLWQVEAALVDPLAVNVVGPMLERERDALASVLDGWATDDDLWIRRASLLAELRPLRAGSPLEPFLARADAMLDEKEFFVRKAIGWVLREVGKRRPDGVIAWLETRTGRASGVTMREAVKYLPAADAERLMRAYRERRPAIT
jgi:3-methyladenine DNA glycosylase AlkD